MLNVLSVLSCVLCPASDVLNVYLDSQFECVECDELCLVSSLECVCRYERVECVERVERVERVEWLVVCWMLGVLCVLSA